MLALRNDGTVAGGLEGLSNVVAIAAAGGDRSRAGLALKDDGTVVGWGGLNPPPGLSNVTAVAAGGFGLLITTNPPPPELAANLLPNGEVAINSAVSVPGYVLEVADDPSQPFVEVPGYTNSFTFTNAENSGLSLPISGDGKVYRLRKR